MTHLTNIEVEGFKGIQSLHFEPTAVNVITGRNNTGKTSLLEAIEFDYDPTSIAAFESNFDTLVNIESSAATIWTMKDGLSRSIEISGPNQKRVRELLFEALFESITGVLDVFISEDLFEEAALEPIKGDLPEIIQNSISPEIVEEVSSEIVILSVDGTEYPYLSSRGTVQKLYRNIGEKLVDRMIDELGKENSKEEIPFYNVNDYFKFGIVNGSDFGYVGETPSASEAVTTVDGGDLTEPPDVDTDESTAVKIDDIEDLLVEHEIVDNLRSFGFDYLVFTDDEGEKYSVPYEFMGDGFKAIVGILWALLDADRSGDVLLMEEPAIHMHPGYVRELVYFLVEIARERDVQLFITTHNNDFVADFFGENLTNEERSFLETEFTLVQMQTDTADVMPYHEAEEQLKNLHLDLRGI